MPLNLAQPRSTSPREPITHPKMSLSGLEHLSVLIDYFGPETDQPTPERNKKPIMAVLLKNPANIQDLLATLITSVDQELAFFLEILFFLSDCPADTVREVTTEHQGSSLNYNCLLDFLTRLTSQFCKASSEEVRRLFGALSEEDQKQFILKILKISPGFFTTNSNPVQDTLNLLTVSDLDRMHTLLLEPKHNQIVVNLFVNLRKGILTDQRNPKLYCQPLANWFELLTEARLRSISSELKDKLFSSFFPYLDELSPLINSLYSQNTDLNLLKQFIIFFDGQITGNMDTLKNLFYALQKLELFDQLFSFICSHLMVKVELAALAKLYENLGHCRDGTKLMQTIVGCLNKKYSIEIDKPETDYPVHHVELIAPSVAHACQCVGNLGEAWPPAYPDILLLILRGIYEVNHGLNKSSQWVPPVDKHIASDTFNIRERSAKPCAKAISYILSFQRLTGYSMQALRLAIKAYSAIVARPGDDLKVPGAFRKALVWVFGLNDENADVLVPEIPDPCKRMTALLYCISPAAFVTALEYLAPQYHPLLLQGLRGLPKAHAQALYQAFSEHLTKSPDRIKDPRSCARAYAVFLRFERKRTFNDPGRFVACLQSEVPAEISAFKRISDSASTALFEIITSVNIETVKADAAWSIIVDICNLGEQSLATRCLDKAIEKFVTPVVDAAAEIPTVPEGASPDAEPHSTVLMTRSLTETDKASPATAPAATAPPSDRRGTSFTSAREFKRRDTEKAAAEAAKLHEQQDSELYRL